MSTAPGFQEGPRFYSATRSQILTWVSPELYHGNAYVEALHVLVSVLSNASPDVQANIVLADPLSCAMVLQPFIGMPARSSMCVSAPVFAASRKIPFPLLQTFVANIAANLCGRGAMESDNTISVLVGHREVLRIIILDAHLMPPAVQVMYQGPWADRSLRLFTITPAAVVESLLLLKQAIPDLTDLCDSAVSRLPPTRAPHHGVSVIAKVAAGMVSVQPPPPPELDEDSETCPTPRKAVPQPSPMPTIPGPAPPVPSAPAPAPPVLAPPVPTPPAPPAPAPPAPAPPALPAEHVTSVPTTQSCEVVKETARVYGIRQLMDETSNGTTMYIGELLRVEASATENASRLAATLGIAEYNPGITTIPDHISDEYKEIELNLNAEVSSSHSKGVTSATSESRSTKERKSKHAYERDGEDDDYARESDSDSGGWVKTPISRKKGPKQFTSGPANDSGKSRIGSYERRDDRKFGETNRITRGKARVKLFYYNRTVACAREIRLALVKAEGRIAAVVEHVKNERGDFLAIVSGKGTSTDAKQSLPELLLGAYRGMVEFQHLFKKETKNLTAWDTKALRSRLWVYTRKSVTTLQTLLRAVGCAHEFDGAEHTHEEE